MTCACAHCGHKFDGEPVGGHRVLCGDSRSAADVETLLSGRKINVAFTSPPYASQRKYDEQTGFRPVRPNDYVGWYAQVAKIIGKNLAVDGSYFCNIKEHSEDGQRHLYVKDLTIAHVRAWGWRFVDEFVWRDTKNGVPGWWANRFKDAWEPVFHFSRRAKIKMYPLANGTESEAAFGYSPGRSDSATGSGLLGSHPENKGQGMAWPSNVIEVAASSTPGHPAAFPVALPAWFIRAFSAPGDAVFDPFVGSGSTLVAAHKEGRVGYGVEISPAYCDVTIQRWATLTDREAVLAGDGRSFAEIASERLRDAA